MKTAEEIVTNLINKRSADYDKMCNIYQSMSRHKFHIQNPSIYLFQLDFLPLFICLMGMRYYNKNK